MQTITSYLFDDLIYYSPTLVLLFMATVPTIVLIQLLVKVSKHPIHYKANRKVS